MLVTSSIKLWIQRAAAKARSTHEDNRDQRLAAKSHSQGHKEFPLRPLGKAGLEVRQRTKDAEPHSPFHLPAMTDPSLERRLTMPVLSEQSTMDPDISLSQRS